MSEAQLVAVNEAVVAYFMGWTRTRPDGKPRRFPAFEARVKEIVDAD